MTYTKISYPLSPYKYLKEKKKEIILTKAYAMGPVFTPRTHFGTSALYSGPPHFKLSILHRGMPNSTIPNSNKQYDIKGAFKISSMHI